LTRLQRWILSTGKISQDICGSTSTEARQVWNLKGFDLMGNNKKARQCAIKKIAWRAKVEPEGPEPSSSNPLYMGVLRGRFLYAHRIGDFFYHLPTQLSKIRFDNRKKFLSVIYFDNYRLLVIELRKILRLYEAYFLCYCSSIIFSCREFL
jgi:hypothetical protein